MQCSFRTGRCTCVQSVECSSLVDCILVACEKCPVAGGEDVVVGADVLAEGVLQARNRAPPLRLDTVSLLSCSAQRVSSQARQRGSPLGLGRVGLLSGSAERTSSQARKTGPPLRFVTGLLSNSTQGHLVGHSSEGLVPGSSQRVSSQALHRSFFWGSA